MGRFIANLGSGLMGGLSWQRGGRKKESMRKESELAAMQQKRLPCVYRFRSLATEFYFSKVCATPSPDLWTISGFLSPFRFCFCSYLLFFFASSFRFEIFCQRCLKGLEFALYGVDIGN